MAITPKSPVDIPNTTGIITPITEPTTSLNNARIGYKNLLTSASASGSSVMLIPNTWERFRPGSSPRILRFQMSESAIIDFVGIAAHNAGTQDGGVEITIGYAVAPGGTVNTLGVMQSGDDNGAYMLIFDAVTAQEIVLTLDAATDGLELGVIYAGKALEMTHGIYGGHTPITLNGKTEYQSVMSESGNFLGRSIVREGIETDYSWRHLGSGWYRENFNPFVKSARKAPFFIKWRPDLYPDEVAFGHTTADIKPMNMSGGSGLMGVSFKMLGHEDVQ